VSIGLPVRNGGQFIARAIESLLAQDYPNFDLLVSDNGSTDDTYDVCRRYEGDPRFRVYRHPENIGAPGNFRYLLAEARGDYFMWAAADDQWEPAFISALLPELIQHRDADVVQGAVRRERESGAPFDVVRWDSATDPSRLAHWRVAVNVARGLPYTMYVYGIYRTAFLRQAYADFLPVHGGDRLFLCKLALSTRFRYVDQVLQTRQVADVLMDVRYADEADSVFGNKPFATWEPIIWCAPYLLRSAMIPAHRKWVVPLLVLLFFIGDHGKTGVYNVFYLATLHLLGPGRQAALRRALRRTLAGRS
jgi:glycosyltransferase involved in cell wall biosynthesis